jgi:hypothetical protein
MGLQLYRGMHRLGDLRRGRFEVELIAADHEGALFLSTVTGDTASPA